MSNMVALKTLELVEVWKFGRWEILEVSLYVGILSTAFPCTLPMIHGKASTSRRTFGK